MANYPINDRVRDELVRASELLLKRHIDDFERTFPLSFDVLQAGVIPERWRRVVPEMLADGWRLGCSNTVRTPMTHLPRKPKIRFNFPRSGKNLIVPDSYSDDVVFDWGVLTSVETEALASWVERSIEIRRRAGLARHLISTFFRDYAPSTGHVRARWPAMTALAEQRAKAFNAVTYSTPHQRDNREAWSAKFDERPKSLARYGWNNDPTSVDWPAKFRRAIDMTEGMLAAALLIPTIADIPVISASIIKWDRLENDKDTFVSQWTR